MDGVGEQADGSRQHSDHHLENGRQSQPYERNLECPDPSLVRLHRLVDSLRHGMRVSKDAAEPCQQASPMVVIPVFVSRRAVGMAVSVACVGPAGTVVPMIVLVLREARLRQLLAVRSHLDAELMGFRNDLGRLHVGPARDEREHLARARRSHRLERHRGRFRRRLWSPIPTHEVQAETRRDAGLEDADLDEATTRSDQNGAVRTFLASGVVER
jgi:hypothetical protein